MSCASVLQTLSTYHPYVLPLDSALNFYSYRFSHIMTDGPGHNPPTGSPQQPPSQGPEPHRTDESIGEDGHQALRTELSSLISEYREKRLSKSKAFSKISSLIDKDLILSDSEKEKAINLYVDELNSINHNAQSRLFTMPVPEKEKTIDDSVHEILDQVSHGVKRGKEQCDDSSGEESDNVDETPHKKPKVKESDMGWYDPNESSLDRDNIIYQETCRLLRVYNKDISRAKFLVRTSRRTPEGIPSSQWERILRGEILNLDHFLSSLHRTTITEEGETRVGNTKISIGVADAKRHVSTAAEWSSAWHLAARAIAFAFPHRAEELRLYGDFISSEFAGKIPSSHPRVILFDIAVRNAVQGGHKYLLTDRSLHLRFYSAILMPDGVEANTSASANRRSTQPRASGSKTDICNRFNTSNGCPSSDAVCKYRHICKNCKKGGHGKEQCPK